MKKHTKGLKNQESYAAEGEAGQARACGTLTVSTFRTGTQETNDGTARV